MALARPSGAAIDWSARKLVHRLNLELRVALPPRKQGRVTCLRRRVITSFTHDSSQAFPLLEEEKAASEDLQADAQLPHLQVQTLEEREIISATPAHPESLYALYAAYVAGCFMERLWRFGLPVVLSSLSDSLLPVASLSFVGQFVIFAGGPLMGAYMDSKPRVLSFNVLSIVQTVCMLLSAALIFYALQAGAPTSGLLLKPWFIILVLSGAIERLTGLAGGIAFERDWVVLLAGSNREIALANANAILRRVDLICEIAGPFLFGILLSKFNPLTCIYIAAMAMATSLPVLIFLVSCTYNLSKGVLDRPKGAISESSSISWKECLTSVKLGWAEYFAQPVLPASLAFVLLYFNAVLGPGSLMTSFLTQRGLDPSILGAFRGMCALMGFVATFTCSAFIRKFGVLKSGMLALLLQAAPLLSAVALYWATQMRHQAYLVTFLILIVMSRLGFWVYEMVDAQIFQTRVSSSQANLVGATEMSLASLAELLMMGVAIVANDVSHFGSLAALSVSAVVAASWLYWRWLSDQHLS